MWLLSIGIPTLIIAQMLHSYCAIGMQAIPTIAPEVFSTRKRIILNATWILLFIAGTSILLTAHWAFGVTALLVYWLGLPVLITPIFKRYMLGSWDDRKHILEKQGYTKDNYLNGDWWKKVTP
ncbi:hypothetical protein ACFLRP_04965 [Bacteroidota bacterium]